MIDLSHKKYQAQKTRDEEPVGLVILGSMPFALLLTVLIFAAMA